MFYFNPIFSIQVSAAIPASFFQLCELLEGMIPDCVHPLCDSVIAHIMIRNSQMTAVIMWSIFNCNMIYDSFLLLFLISL